MRRVRLQLWLWCLGFIAARGWSFGPAYCFCVRRAMACEDWRGILSGRSEEGPW